MAPTTIQTPNRARRRGVVAVVAAVTLLIGSCGVPEDGEPEVLGPVLPTVSVGTPTPVPAAGSVTVEVFLLDVNENMSPVSRELPGDEVRASALVNELIAQTTEEEAALGLTSAVPPGLVFNSAPRIEDGTAQLDFVVGGLDALLGDELNKALAQIVWTLSATDQIDSIVISIGGEPQTWPTDFDDAQVLTKALYETFDPDFVEEVQPTPEPVDNDEDGG